ncbi:MAG: hypothetical protein KF915_20295 [Polyangiaceae bacterium]|nr:hypothetical protein [Polyangiaceae bacterium]
MSDHQPSPAEDAEDAIPVKGIKPLYLGIGAGVALLAVIGLVLSSVVGGNKLPEDRTPAGVAVAPADTSKMTPEELKAHLEMTRKAIQVTDAEEAQAKARAAAAKKAAEEAQAEADAPKKTGGGAAGPAPKPGPAPGKQAAKLDDIAAEITGTLK